MTGISIEQSELIGKRLDLLREVVPHLRRLVIMANAGYAMPVLEAQEAKATAQALGLEAARLEIWRSEDIAPAFEAIRGKADALYVVSDALIAANRTLITTLALSARLPTILSYGDYVEAGGLMSYGPNYANLFRQAADMVDKILHGTKPSDIPVEQPSKFELVINLAHGPSDWSHNAVNRPCPRRQGDRIRVERSLSVQLLPRPVLST